jgi:hypothetical protein
MARSPLRSPPTVLRPAMQVPQGSELAHALRDATEVDVLYEEERLVVHASDASTKVGCRPIEVRGVPVPRPPLVAYVRAEDVRGEYWYVLDRSKVGAAGKHDETFVDSEEEARSLVLARLRAAAEAGLL